VKSERQRARVFTVSRCPSFHLYHNDLAPLYWFCSSAVEDNDLMTFSGSAESFEDYAMTGKLQIYCTSFGDAV
jgi:hypothetical protein